MAQLVEIMGVGHNPNYPSRFLKSEDEDPGITPVRKGFAEMKQVMTDARPDVLVVIGNDHLNQLFMDNMPAFLIGKAQSTAGPPQWEQDLGIPPTKAEIHQELARAIVRCGFEKGVDFAFSDDLVIDHSITIPLTYCRPVDDLPIVPLLTNVLSPPIPPASRYFKVGQALRSIIEEWPADVRVGVLASGHLAVEVGGPKGRGYSPDPEFDDLAVEIIGKGDVDGLMRLATWERMMQAGNVTAGFLDFVMLVGVAMGEPASRAELAPCTNTNPAPFFSWDLSRGRKE